MIRRGHRLRAFAASVFDAGTMARVIDPAIADLQIERRPWAGYLAVLKVIVLCGLGGSMLVVRSWPDDERRTMWRTIGISLMALAGLTLALEVPPLGIYGHAAWLPNPVTLLPQALAISVPMALTFGVAFGFGGRVVSRRLKLAVAAIALVCSAASLANLAWVVPDANQAFRVHAAAQNGIDARSVPRGVSELTIGELRQQVRTQRGAETMSPWAIRSRAMSYYARWAISAAPLALTALMLSILAGEPVRRLILGLFGVGAVSGFYVLTYFGRFLALQYDLPSVVAAWLADVVFLLIPVVLTTLSASRRVRNEKQKAEG